MKIKSIYSVEASQKRTNGRIRVRLDTQLALPSFLSSVTSSSKLVLQMLPPGLCNSTGIRDHLFDDVVELRSFAHNRIRFQSPSPLRELG